MPKQLLARLQWHSCPGEESSASLCTQGPADAASSLGTELCAGPVLPAAPTGCSKLLAMRMSRPSSKLTAENTNRGEKKYKSLPGTGRSANTALQNTAVLFLTWATPFVGRATAGAAAVVITPPDTLSTVVPGLESWDEAGTDFMDPSDIFTSDVCPLDAAFEKKCSVRKTYIS